jgi:hypothetical protein
MEPLSYSEWCATEERIDDPVRRRERYQAYLAGVHFIRSQIGGLPRPAWSRLPASDASAHAVR